MENMEAMSAMSNLMMTLLIVFGIRIVIDFIIYVCFTISLIRKGVDPVQYYEMVGRGQIPIMIPVEINVRTESCEITNRWHGRDQFGFVIKTGEEERSVNVTEAEWNIYKTGDRIVMGMEIVKNKETGEIMEDCCRYYVLNNAPDFEMRPAEIPLGKTMIIKDKNELKH